MSKLKVVQDEQGDPPVEVIANSIVQMSKAMQILVKSRLKREAIVVLIHHRSKIGIGTIERVLNNLEQLEEIWLKKKPGSKK